MRLLIYSTTTTTDDDDDYIFFSYNKDYFLDLEQRCRRKFSLDRSDWIL